MNIEIMRNPKRSHSSNSGKSQWYNYYAGFSTDFVSDTLRFLNPPKGAIILDPWNGSGTTTQISEEMGFSAIGYDLNPVMVIVAKARAFRRNKSSNLIEIGKNIINQASLCPNIELHDKEPLESWLMPSGSFTFRCLDRSIQYVTMKNDEYNPIFKSKHFSNISGITAFFYVALFRTLRRSLVPFNSSNPTWIRMPKASFDRLNIQPEEIYSIFIHEINDMSKAFDYFVGAARNCDPTESTIDVASSHSIPLPDQYVHAVISSPPYCTRIDYAIATKPELALLGCPMDNELKKLRDLMIGTPTILKSQVQINPNWGAECISFLNNVMNHSSKASKSYYLKYYIQYFDSIYKSLLEIDRILIKNGYCVLVVQDSYYKDIHNDLALIFTQIGKSIDWKLCLHRYFDTNRNMVGINPKAKIYRKSTKATESILIFKNIN